MILLLWFTCWTAHSMAAFSFATLAAKALCSAKVVVFTTEEAMVTNRQRARSPAHLLELSCLLGQYLLLVPALRRWRGS